MLWHFLGFSLTDVTKGNLQLDRNTFVGLIYFQFLDTDLQMLFQCLFKCRSLFYIQAYGNTDFYQETISSAWE